MVYIKLERSFELYQFYQIKSSGTKL